MVGDRIRRRREELGMTQQDLADKVGYKDRSSINRIEQGSREISRSMIVELARALDTTPPYLMGWEDSVNQKTYVIRNELQRIVMDEVAKAEDRKLNKISKMLEIIADEEEDW